MRSGRRRAGLVLSGIASLAIAGAFFSTGLQNPVLRLYWGAGGLFLLLAGATLTAGHGTTRRFLGISLYVLWLVCLLEGGSALALRLKTGEWHWKPTDPSIFDPHPWLVGVPRPGVTVEQGGKVIHHNSLGLRGREITPRKPGMPRVVTLGGSTTYCTGVSEGETWPEELERRLDPAVQVVNLGVPGYTTVEHLIQTALNLSDLHPDVAIYYEGWNDLLNAHIENLRSDYSDFHGHAQYHALHLPEVWTGPDLAFLRLGKTFLCRLGWVPEIGYQAIHVRGHLSGEPDDRALSLYRRNLGLIVALCRRQGIEPVFVPQVLNAPAFLGHAPFPGTWYVPNDGVMGLLADYNRTMEEVAGENQVPYAGEVLSAHWGPEDFVDKGHFSPSGNRRFAALLAPRLQGLVARVATGAGR